MATCDYQELLSENPCLSALSEFDLEVIKTQLLCNWARGCDRDELIEDARCMSMNLSETQIQLLKTQLLCNIVSNEIPIATLYPSPAVFTWVVPTAEIDGAPFWGCDSEDPPNCGIPPDFTCGDTTVDLKTEYFFGLFQDEDPNDQLSEDQISCMLAIAEIVVDDYLAGSGETEVSRIYWWEWISGNFNAKRGTVKAASGNCDPNNPIGDSIGNFPVGAVELSIKLCVTPP